MTTVRRPIHLQLSRPTSLPLGPSSCSPEALTPPGDSMPSEILPHLFVGNQEQTNRDTVNRLNISYILSLGLLPLISNSKPPTTATPATDQNINLATTSSSAASTNDDVLLPSQNSSKDFKIHLRLTSGGSNNCQQQQDSSSLRKQMSLDCDEENKAAVKAVRHIQCKCINIADDNSGQSLTKFFDEAHQFIDEARRKKCNILVHCLAGVSRSPTIAIAYLMRVNSLRLQDAYNLVKKCRPQIDPNLSFMGQLMIYGKRLITSCCRPMPSSSRQPSDNSNLAINMNPCDRNHHHNVNIINHHHQIEDTTNEMNLVEEHTPFPHTHNLCECDLSHLKFLKCVKNKSH